jgi:beta-galactosidase
VAAEAGVAPVVAGLPAGVDAVRRRGPGGSWVFLLDHSGAGAQVPVLGTDLVTGARATAQRPLALAPGAVAVVREDGPAPAAGAG